MMLSNAPLHITTYTQNNITIIRPNGEINTDNCYELEELLTQKMDYGMNKVVLNFRHVSYIDSATIGMIIAAWIKANSKGFMMRLCELNKEIDEVFTLSRIDKFLPIDITEADSLGHLDNTKNAS